MADAAPDQQYPERLVELAAIVNATLVDGGIEPEAARKFADAVRERVREVWGGQTIYIPSRKYTVEYMRREIGRRWIGANTGELCGEFEISESRLRQLYDEGRQ